jgi:hypothetical protein
VNTVCKAFCSLIPAVFSVRPCLVCCPHPAASVVPVGSFAAVSSCMVELFSQHCVVSLLVQCWLPYGGLISHIEQFAIPLRSVAGVAVHCLQHDCIKGVAVLERKRAVARPKCCCPSLTSCPLWAGDRPKFVVVVVLGTAHTRLAVCQWLEPIPDTCVH